MSLAQLLKNHHQKQAESKRQNDQLRKEALNTTHTLTDTVSDHVNQGVSTMFAKQKALEQASKELATQTSRYTKQTKQWLTLVDDFNDALKELGDVKNWTQVMEQDMKTVMATLDFVYQGNIDATTKNRPGDEHSTAISSS
ncbi:biogenesis of lysosome-related organelles complex 1 subunit 1 [Halteromyces radiatus]|uniref:biogenesis of lysosome-related organelles complex 1 subunit 1 n=1 Tax=Halteromyces radiatus TaxID=101107 RepID=UPI0022206660|nr:biogenesis of lysosome-related organelles complex 1 subunit 1 [Halteromyces radiatus]KAI8089644.1 biogenesis of lysosome-related organelles complex 1 subunit 1 [Halteromyces radiatus]